MKNERSELEIKLALMEERVKKLEASLISQAKLLREHTTYIVHLRKHNKKLKVNS
jgi:uncharacterized coiled-coil protein SlyX